jgi:hypothetical protein
MRRRRERILPSDARDGERVSATRGATRKRCGQPNRTDNTMKRPETLTHGLLFRRAARADILIRRRQRHRFVAAELRTSQRGRTKQYRRCAALRLGRVAHILDAASSRLRSRAVSERTRPARGDRNLDANISNENFRRVILGGRIRCDFAEISAERGP